MVVPAAARWPAVLDGAATASNVFFLIFFLFFPMFPTLLIPFSNSEFQKKRPTTVDLEIKFQKYTSIFLCVSVL